MSPLAGSECYGSIIKRYIFVYVLRFGWIHGVTGEARIREIMTLIVKTQFGNGGSRKNEIWLA